MVYTANLGGMNVNVNQIMYDLTYWFDYTTRMMLNHPLISVTTVVGAFLFHQILGAMKLISSVITFALSCAYGSFLRLAHVLSTPSPTLDTGML